MFRFRTRDRIERPWEGACYHAAGHVTAARHGDRTVLLDHDGGRYYGLDEVGTRIWEMVEDGATLDHVATTLAGEYDAPAEVLRGDAGRLLAELADLQLVSAR